MAIQKIKFTSLPVIAAIFIAVGGIQYLVLETISSMALVIARMRSRRVAALAAA